MANETEVIREKMEATRTDLSDKIEKLEKQVVNTVQEATSTVAEAVHGAKEVVETVKDSVEGAMGTVKDTVDSVRDTMENVTGAVGGAVEGVKDTFEGAAESVKETFEGAAEAVRKTFDLPKQVQEHPWLMMGGAVAVGFVAGKLLDYAPEAARAVGRAAEAGGRLAESITTTAGAAASAAGGLWGALERTFGPELGRVKELALGALIGVIRDVIVQSAPESMSRQVREIIDGFTSKLGGKPVEGSVLGPRPSEEEAPNGPGRRF